MSTQPEAPPPPGRGPSPWAGAPFGDPNSPHAPYPPYAPQVSRDEKTSAADRLVFSLTAVLGGVAAGFVGGAVWAAVADPPLALYTRHGVYLNSEVGYDHRVAVTLWFLIVGLAGGVLSGMIVAWLGRRHGVAAVVAALAMSVAAAGINAWSGIHVFGPDLSNELAGASFGDMVRTALTITSDVAYLGWPIGSLVGVLVAISLAPNGRSKRRNAHEPSSGSDTVVAH